MALKEVKVENGPGVTYRFTYSARSSAYEWCPKHGGLRPKHTPCMYCAEDEAQLYAMNLDELRRLAEQQQRYCAACGVAEGELHKSNCCKLEPFDWLFEQREA